MEKRRPQHMEHGCRLGKPVAGVYLVTILRIIWAVTLAVLLTACGTQQPTAPSQTVTVPNPDPSSIYPTLASVSASVLPDYVSALPDLSGKSDNWAKIGGTHCWAYNPLSIAGNGVNWTGACTNGFVSGTGTLSISTGSGNPVETNSGTFFVGVQNGSGTVTYYNDAGNKNLELAGIFIGGLLKSGVITWFDPSGIVRQTDQGQFSDQVPNTGSSWEGAALHRGSGSVDYVLNGAGKISYFDSNGDPVGGYQGSLEAGVPNGVGKRVFYNGQWYVGYWNSGLAEGYGTYYDVNGTILADGTFQEGCITYQDANGDGEVTHQSVSMDPSEDQDTIMEDCRQRWEDQAQQQQQQQAQSIAMTGALLGAVAQGINQGEQNNLNIANEFHVPAPQNPGLSATAALTSAASLALGGPGGGPTPVTPTATVADNGPIVPQGDNSNVPYSKWSQAQKQALAEQLQEKSAICQTEFPTANVPQQRVYYEQAACVEGTFYLGVPPDYPGRAQLLTDFEQNKAQAEALGSNSPVLANMISR